MTSSIDPIMMFRATSLAPSPFFARMATHIILNRRKYRDSFSEVLGDPCLMHNLRQHTGSCSESIRSQRPNHGPNTVLEKRSVPSEVGSARVSRLEKAVKLSRMLV